MVLDSQRCVADGSDAVTELSEESAEISLRYSTDLLDDATAERMLEQLRVLAEDAAKRPGCTV